MEDTQGFVKIADAPDMLAPQSSGYRSGAALVIVAVSAAASILWAAKRRRR